MSLFYKEPEINDKTYTTRLEKVYENAYKIYHNTEKNNKEQVEPLDVMSLIIIDLDGEESDILGDLLVLGGLVGFSWEEIYKAYVNKNDKNYDRQLNVEGYK